MTTVKLGQGLASAIGNAVRQARIEAGLSKSDAARNAGLSRRTWHEIEEGQRLTTTEETLTCIEETLRLPRDELFGLTGLPQLAHADELVAKAERILHFMSRDDLEHFIETNGRETFRQHMENQLAELRQQLSELQRNAPPTTLPPVVAGDHNAGDPSRHAATG